MRDRKASAEELKRGVFDVIAHRRAEVKESAAMGGDAAVVDCGEVLLHTDPITGRCMDIGSLAIKVVSNDVAAAGGELVAVLLTVLLPKEFSVEDLKKIMSDAEAECGKIGAEIVGGHSEFTSAVTRPVVSAMAVAKRLPGFTAIAPKAGDDIVMTKTAAMEATVLMAERAPLPLDEEELNEIAFMKENLGIIRDARVAALSTPVRMHDVTEGGIENAVYEVLSGAGVGGVIGAAEVPVADITKKLAAAFGVNPLRCLSSGALIAITPFGERLTEDLKKAGIPAKVIGKVTDGDIFIEENGVLRALSGSSDEFLEREV